MCLGDALDDCQAEANACVVGAYAFGAALKRLGTHGAELVSSEVVQYEDAYRLCYIRGPEGLLIGLAQELGWAPGRSSTELRGSW